MADGEPAPHFDIAAQVRHATLPTRAAKGSCEWYGDFLSHRLDRRRPLWETVLVDGLADGRWALATKTHHCLVDGMGSVDAGRVLLDAAPSPPPIRRAANGASRSRRTIPTRSRACTPSS